MTVLSRPSNCPIVRLNFDSFSLKMTVLTGKIPDFDIFLLKF